MSRKAKPPRLATAAARKSDRPREPINNCPNRSRVRAQDPLSAIHVYDGRQMLGAVLELAGGRFEAAAADGRPLGVHPSIAAAQRAILAARRS